MELGTSGTIAVKQFSSFEDVDKHINRWLEDNPDIEVIDIKISTSVRKDYWATDALVVYRK
jgi:hypothetical protein